MAAIDIQRAGATAILTMNRPEQRNALDYPMREAFAAAVAEVRDDAAVRAVVLTGAAWSSKCASRSCCGPPWSLHSAFTARRPRRSASPRA